MLQMTAQPKGQLPNIDLRWNRYRNTEGVQRLTEFKNVCLYLPSGMSAWSRNTGE